jgi:type II secretory pathway component PulF
MRYRSTILETDGSTTTAVLEASDEQSLHNRVHRDGRQLLRAQPLERATARPAANVRLSPRRLLLLTQALGEALDAGVPLLGTFHAVAEQETDTRIAGLLVGIGDRVAAGQPLSEALAAHPRSFPTVYCALVRAGEQSGSLPQVLRSIATFLEWRIEIAGTVKQALVYPSVVAAAGYAMVLFLLSFVIPRLGDVIGKMGADLPPASVMLIRASGFVAAHVGAIVAASVAAVAAAVFLLRMPAVRAPFVAAFARLPVIGSLLTTLAIAQFARTFGVLLNAGLTMTAALEFGGAAVALPSMRERVAAVKERILGGARLGEAMREERLLPPVALSMVRVGEEAGRLPITFDRLGNVYDREVKAAVKRALALLEPFVTVVLGVVVGGVAVLVVGTIYSAMKGVGR